ncbi:hypothetical protein [Aliarcobacter butzleri]
MIYPTAAVNPSISVFNSRCAIEPSSSSICNFHQLFLLKVSAFVA